MARVVRWAAAVLAATIVTSGVSSAAPDPQGGARPPGGWVTTWGAANNGPLANSDPGCVGCSIRNVVHTSVSGTAVRVRLSNVFSAKPVIMAHVTVGVAAGNKTPAAVPGTVRTLTFGGRQSGRIAPGSEVLSDPVELAVPTDGDLLVTTYTPTPSGPITYQRAAYQTSFIARTGGDHTSEEAATSYTETTGFTQYLAGVEVLAPAARGTVVALGDSITAGSGSGSNTNQRWPDVLSDRIQASPPGHRFGVANSGIPGNALLNDSAATGGVNALSRLDRDVFDKAGLRTVIVLLGINDPKSGTGADPDDVIAALHQIADQAHARGVRVLGGTITPFKGAKGYTEAFERNRGKVNEFIRAGNVFDGVVDFDAAVQDPADPLTLRPDFDSGDHLHPNPAGYRAMGTAVDLRLL